MRLLSAMLDKFKSMLSKVGVGKKHRTDDSFSHYELISRVYEGLEVPQSRIYRDIKTLPSYHPNIIEHLAMIDRAYFCLKEGKLFPASIYKVEHIPRYAWFKDSTGAYINLELYWNKLVSSSTRLLRLYEQELNSIETMSQTNLYRLGPIIDLTIDIARSLQE